MCKCVCCVFVCICMYCVVHVHLCGVYYEHFTLLVDCQRGALHNLWCSLPYVCKSSWNHCLLLNSMCWSSWSIRCEWVWSSSPARRQCAGSCIVLYCMYVCMCVRMFALYCIVSVPVFYPTETELLVRGHAPASSLYREACAVTFDVLILP